MDQAQPGEGAMSDLFASIPPRRLKIGQANGEFLARLAMLHPSERGSVRPRDFPDATPAYVRANARFHGGRS